MKRVSCTYDVRYDLSDADQKKLAAVFARLPNFCGYDEDSIPAWYGRSEETHHLFASVEPSGLLVEGVLDEHDWTVWDAEFRKLASDALGLEIRDADE
jgi:hypothetical protein